MLIKLVLTADLGPKAEIYEAYLRTGREVRTLDLQPNDTSLLLGAGLHAVRRPLLRAGDPSQRDRHHEGNRRQVLPGQLGEPHQIVLTHLES